MGNKFLMRLASLKKGVVYSSLDMQYFTNTDESTGYTTPLPIKLAVGKKVGYGPLFAYLFRRFGYPNFGWDDYKEHSKYLLTTPLPDMVLEVVPYCADSSDISFSFRVAEDARRRIRDFERRDYLAWRERLFDWVESNGLLPDWLETGMEYLNQGREVPLTWRQDYESLYTLHLKRGKKTVSVGYNWHHKIHKAFSKIEPEPHSSVVRSYDWREWPDDDPAKAYNQAAYEALLDLSRPVQVRDIFINAFGRVESPERSKILDGAPAAGYPAGALGNEDPEGFSVVHSLIEKLGNGNAKKGIKKAIPILEAAIQPAKEAV